MNHTCQTVVVTFALFLTSGCVATRSQHEFEVEPPVASQPPTLEAPAPEALPARVLLVEFTGKRDAAPIWTLADRDGFFFTAGMAIDADGAPNAYHPDGTSGLDFLANAGRPGNWWGLATDTNRPSGNPLIQTSGQYKGFYVSHTALCVGPKPDADVTKYVDARRVPFLALPPQLLKPGMAQLGDLAVVYNTRNARLEYAIVADIGPRDALGEGSIALAANLGMNTDMRNRTAGQDAGVVYLVFPGTAAEPAWPRTVDDIRGTAAAALEAWGGLDQLKAVTGR